MKLLFLMLFSMLPYSKADNDTLNLQNGDVFIYEYAIKKPGQAYIGFIIINEDLIVQDVYFTIYFSGKEIKKIKREIKEENKKFSFSKKENGDIFIKNINLVCFKSQNFNNKKRLIPDKIYKMISPDFLNTTNYDRLLKLNSQ